MIKRRIPYNPSSENEKEILILLDCAKKQIKAQYKSNGDLELSQIENFYKILKKSNQIFNFLTKKDHDSLYIKFKTQKILYYLIQILIKNETTNFVSISTENILKVDKFKMKPI